MASKPHGDRHRWNGLDGYLLIHDKRIADFDHFIVDNGLRHTVTPTVVTWDGIIRFQGGIEVKVEREQAARTNHGRLQVRTETYSYHAYRRVGRRTTNIIRYDNAHPYAGHPDAHHRHRYEPDGTEGPVEHVGHDDWPTLGDVIQELYDLWVSEQSPAPQER
jgi:hypothetical protein